MLVSRYSGAQCICERPEIALRRNQPARVPKRAELQNRGFEVEGLQMFKPSFNASLLAPVQLA
jgi:hypothetical protein